MRLSGITPVPRDPAKKEELAQFIVFTMEEIGRQQFEEKRKAMEEVLAKAIESGTEISRFDYFIKAISRMSIDSFFVLRSFLGPGVIRDRQQFHPGTPPLSDLQTKFGFDYLVALLRELESLALVGLDIDHSSITHDGNSRIIVWWKKSGQDFLEYVKMRG